MARATSPLKASSHYPENYDPNLGSRIVISQDERGDEANKSGGSVLHEINGILNSRSPKKDGTKIFTPPHRHPSKSPKCAENLPDYAVPATVPPRKFLVSKRDQAGIDFLEQQNDAGSSIRVQTAFGYENMKHGDEEMNPMLSSSGLGSHVQGSDIRVHNVDDSMAPPELSCCSLAIPCAVPLMPNNQDQANERNYAEESEGKMCLQEQSQGRRACGSRVQHLVQAFESMISLAEGRKIQSCGEQTICSRKSESQSISSASPASGMACDSETSDDRASLALSIISKIGAWNTGLVSDKIGEARCEAQVIPQSTSATESALCGIEEPAGPGKVLESIKESEQGEDDQSESTTSYESEIEASTCASYEFHSGVTASIPQRRARATCLRPFTLRTQARGAQKEHAFRKKLEKMMAEDRQLRVPVAQGLPWTTDEPEIVPKPPAKENTVPMELRLYTEYRSVQRAQFDEYVAAKIMYIEEQRQEQQRLQELAEEEEVKRLRKQMVPRAQLMPYFDRPFIPRRCSKRLTIPKEPSFHASHDHKRAKCMLAQTDR